SRPRTPKAARIASAISLLTVIAPASFQIAFSMRAEMDSAPSPHARARALGLTWMTAPAQNEATRINQFEDDYVAAPNGRPVRLSARRRRAQSLYRWLPPFVPVESEPGTQPIPTRPRISRAIDNCRC